MYRLCCADDVASPLDGLDEACTLDGGGLCKATALQGRDDGGIQLKRGPGTHVEIGVGVVIVWNMCCVVCVLLFVRCIIDVRPLLEACVFGLQRCQLLLQVAQLCPLLFLVLLAGWLRLWRSGWRGCHLQHLR